MLGPFYKRSLKTLSPVSSSYYKRIQNTNRLAYPSLALRFKTSRTMSTKTIAVLDENELQDGQMSVFLSPSLVVEASF
jgi:hypothetical protein